MKLKTLVKNAFRVKVISHKANIPFLNEAINFKKRTIFIAIPKTGTTSVRTQLSQKGLTVIRNPHLNIVQVRDLLFIHVLKESLGKNTIFPNENHPTDSVLREKTNELFDDLFKFSAFRNPWARVVSLYFRREGINVREEMTFDEFCDKHLYASDTCHQPTLHKNQYDWLSDEKGKNLMDFIYKVEEFENAILEIEKLTNGRIKLRNVNRNNNPVSQSKKYRDLYNENTQKMIGKRFEKDIDIFKYTF